MVGDDGVHSRGEHLSSVVAHEWIGLNVEVS